MVLLPLTRSVSPMQLVPQSIPSTTLAPGDPLPGLGVIDRVGVLDRRPGVRGDGGDRGLDLRVRPHRHRHLRAGADRRTDRRPAVERRVGPQQHRRGRPPARPRSCSPSPAACSARAPRSSRSRRPAWHSRAPRRSSRPRRPAPCRPGRAACCCGRPGRSLIHISEPTRLGMISYAVFCLKKKKKNYIQKKKKKKKTRKNKQNTTKHEKTKK